nr:hypothetical protein [Tanacetum cinerariifolium]
MVGTENLSPRQPPQANTSSTGARDGNKCTEKVPTRCSDSRIVVHWIGQVAISPHFFPQRDFVVMGDAYNFVKSHEFATTHGSNIVIDETTERGNSLERQRIHELDSEPISAPELQLPLSSVSLSEDIGPSTSDVDDRSTTEAISMNNVNPVNVYSLSGCVPDAEADATGLQCINHGPQGLPNYSYCFRATTDDGATITSLTCFSPEAHTLTQDSNEVVNELSNKDPGVEMLSLYIRWSTDESRCYGYTLDGQRRSRDAIVVHEMFNRGVDMLSLYMRHSTEESRCYRYTCDVQRMSRDAIVVHEMFNG